MEGWPLRSSQLNPDVKPIDAGEYLRHIFGKCIIKPIDNYFQFLEAKASTGNAQNVESNMIYI